MNETIESTDETFEANEHDTPLSKEEVEERMAEFEAQGVPVEHECHDCDATFDHPVLPEETDGSNVLLCRSCATDLLRDAEFL